MKRKIGLIVGYVGEGYFGLQYNKELNTIEKVILEALLKTESITEINSLDPKKIDLKSSSRTDKGVHASFSLITVKIIREPDEKLFLELRNILALKNINLYKIVKLSKRFVGYKMARSRVYKYIIPTYFLKNDCFEKDYMNLLEKDRIAQKMDCINQNCPHDNQDSDHENICGSYKNSDKNHGNLCGSHKDNEANLEDICTGLSESDSNEEVDNIRFIDKYNNSCKSSSNEEADDIKPLDNHNYVCDSYKNQENHQLSKYNSNELSNSAKNQENHQLPKYNSNELNNSEKNQEKDKFSKVNSNNSSNSSDKLNLEENMCESSQDLQSKLEESSIKEINNKSIHRTYSSGMINPILKYKSDKIDDLRFILNHFVGTKNFHNFTIKSVAGDVKRHIKSINVSEPFIRKDIEYIEVEIHGQSFLLHQIRKMMSFAVLNCKYCQIKEDKKRIVENFDLAFSNQMVHIPKSPSQYLYLNNIYFDDYNAKNIEKIEVDLRMKSEYENEKIYPCILKEDNILEWFKYFDSIYFHHDKFSMLK